MPGASYVFQVDTLRNGTYGAPIDDLTSRLIGSLDFTAGMDSADQDFAIPARMNLMLDNTDGAFNPDILGTEAVANNSFGAWTLNNPNSWTVAGEVGADPEISQVGQSETHGGSGTNSVNFYATSATVSIAQTTLTVGTTYRVVLEVTAASPTNTGWLAIYSGATRVSPYYHLPGSYTIYFNAVSTTFKIASGGAVNMTIDSVSVRATSVYGQLLCEGTLGRLQATFNAVTYTLFIGRLASLIPTPGSISRRVVTLMFSDPTWDLLDTEYLPTLMTDVTADVPMTSIFEAPVVPFPYAHSYWILGTQGASELDLTTYVYAPPSYTFDVGKSVYSWVGDNSIDNGKGVSAQSYLRDLVSGEVGARFFYDASLPGYIFHNRHRDPLNTTVAFTIADGDYEPEMSVYTRQSVLNHSSVSYQPRKTGTVGAVIWSTDKLPFYFPKGTMEFTARYRDLSNPSARVGATAVIPPLAGVDLIANTLGRDVSSDIGVSIEIGASSAIIKLTNASYAQVTNLQLRGTALTTFDPQTVESVNGESQRAYKKASERVDYRLIDNDVDAQNIADYRVYKNSIAVTTFDKLGFIANKTDSRMTMALSVGVGDRITINDTWLGHNADSFVAGFRHKIIWGGEHTHETTLTLKTATREAFWILGTSALGIDTRLGL